MCFLVLLFRTLLHTAPLEFSTSCARHCTFTLVFRKKLFRWPNTRLSRNTVLKVLVTIQKAEFRLKSTLRSLWNPATYSNQRIKVFPFSHLWDALVRARSSIIPRATAVALSQRKSIVPVRAVDTIVSAYTNRVASIVSVVGTAEVRH